MKRRTFLGGAMAVAVVGQGSRALAQQPPIKIGMSMPQTGGLAGGGKASLLGIEIWRDDINAKGGLLGRKVELIVYDDKSSASETPAIYAKLVDVDKVDLLFAPYATVPTAPLMPFVKQRGLLLMGNFSFQVNSKVGHDMWFNNAPWGPADSWASSFLDLGSEGRRQEHGAARGGPGVRPEPRADRAGCRQAAQPPRRLRPVLSAEHGGIRLHHPRAQGRQARHRLCRVLSAGLGRHSACRERDRDRRRRQDFRRRHGRPAVRGRDVQSGLAAQRRRQLQHLAAGTEHVFRRHQGVFRDLHQARRRGQGRSARLLSGAVRLCDGPDDRGGGQRHQVARPEGHRQISARERAQDHRRADRVFGGWRAQGNARRCRRSSGA